MNELIQTIRLIFDFHMLMKRKEKKKRHLKIGVRVSTKFSNKYWYPPPGYGAPPNSEYKLYLDPYPKYSIRRLFVRTFKSATYSLLKSFLLPLVNKRIGSKNALEITIIGLSLARYSEKLIKSYMILLLSTLIYFSYTVIFDEAFNPIYLSAISLLSLTAIASHIVIFYRIKNNYYGDNEYEAREIINIINKNNNDNSGGYKIKDLFPKVEKGIKKYQDISSGVKS